MDSRPFLCLTLVMRRKKISFCISLVGSKSNHLSYSLCYPVGIFQISQKVMHKMFSGEETQLPFIRGGRF